MPKFARMNNFRNYPKDKQVMVDIHVYPESMTGDMETVAVLMSHGDVRMLADIVENASESKG